MTKEEKIEYLKQMNLGTPQTVKQQALADILNNSIFPNSNARELVRRTMGEIKNHFRFSDPFSSSVSIYTICEEEMYIDNVVRLLVLLGYKAKNGYDTIDIDLSSVTALTSPSPAIQTPNNNSSNGDDLLIMGAIGLGLGILLF